MYHSTCIVSILRLQSLYVISKAQDITWENPLAAIWSSVEANTGILCSCLPTLRSCVSRIFPKFLSSVRSANGTQRRTEKSTYLSSGTRNSEMPRIPAPTNSNRKPKMSFDALGRGLTGRDEVVQQSYAYSGADSSSEEHELDQVPMPTGDLAHIQVTTTVDQDFESIGPLDEYQSRFGRFGSSFKAASQSGRS
jgi:hypothetical protein